MRGQTQGWEEGQKQYFHRGEYSSLEPQPRDGPGVRAGPPPRDSPGVRAGPHRSPPALVEAQLLAASTLVSLYTVLGAGLCVHFCG